VTAALLIIDVQNDFTSKASDGSQVAGEISEYAQANRHHYDYIVASRDWHDGGSDNGGHFPSVLGGGSLRWIPHCVAGSTGAEYDALLTTCIDVHVKKGQGFPGYSIFEGTTEEGEPFPERTRELGITDIDVVGIATEGCVAAAAHGGVALGLRSRVLLELCRGFDADRISRRLEELRADGVGIVETRSTHECRLGARVSPQPCGPGN
jgi:nicotinamidase/pyrazinamidase